MNRNIVNGNNENYHLYGVFPPERIIFNNSRFDRVIHDLRNCHCVGCSNLWWHTLHNFVQLIKLYNTNIYSDLVRSLNSVKTMVFTSKVHNERIVIAWQVVREPIKMSCRIGTFSNYDSKMKRYCWQRTNWFVVRWMTSIIMWTSSELVRIWFIKYSWSFLVL